MSPDELVSSAGQNYVRGNYHQARTMIDAADRSKLSEETREELDSLEDNLRPQPYARALAMLSFLLFLSVLGLAYFQ